MYALQIDDEKTGKGRDVILALFNANKIQTRPVWYLNHWQKPYLSSMAYRIENAPRLWAKTLNIPCSVSLTDEQIRKVVRVLANT